jgi:hypothetical protein
MLVLTAIAAVGGITGLALLIWAWIDRPHYGWGVRIARRLAIADFSNPGHGKVRQLSIGDGHEATVKVRAESTAVAYDVTLRLHGCTLKEAPDGLWSTRMEAGSDPIEVEVWIPPAGGRTEGVFLDIIWNQLRPRRKRGYRVDLVGNEERWWRWRWRSLRVRNWTLRRTRGHWSPRPGLRKRPSLPVIPE